MKTKRVLDSVNLVLGLWLIASPWVLGVASAGAVTWSAVIFGAAIVAASVWSHVSPHARAPEWSQVSIATVLWLTPWLLGFTELENAAWNAWVVGVLAVTVAWMTFGEIGGSGLGDVPRMPHQGESH